MAINRRGKSYQAKLQGTDGRWISRTFRTKAEAEEFERELKAQKASGGHLSNEVRKLTLSEYFAIWHRDTQGTKASDGWRATQIQMFERYIEPVMGSVRLSAVTPAMVSQVIQRTAQMKRSSQTRRHVFNLMRKVFGDAVELHEFLDRNPVKKSLKPSLEETEQDFLESGDLRRLLEHVRGQSFEIAVWLGAYVGLRVGEIQALLWQNVDLEKSLIHIRRTYVRREHRFKEYPKGRRWHSVPMPPELRVMLEREKKTAVSEYVVTSPRRPFLNYDGYLRALKRYCREIGIKQIATHNLRHSTPELWKGHGASDEDMQDIYGHSDRKVTKRYIHFESAKRLGKIANVIRLFPDQKSDKNTPPSQNLPKVDFERVDAVEQSVLSVQK